MAFWGFSGADIWKLTKCGIYDTIRKNPENPENFQDMEEKKKLKHDDYTIGWVTAVDCELDASRLLLDEEHESLPLDAKDTNAYVLGRAGPHNVVVSGPLAPGTSVAAQVVTNMVRSFPKIRFGLMVGVGGGAPRPPDAEDPAKDIRLGDIVVSTPKGRHGGVLQYDMGQQKDDEFSIESHLNKPPDKLRSAVKMLRSDHVRGDGQMDRYINNVAVKVASRRKLKNYKFPGRAQDRLFKANHRHVGGSNCSACCVDGMTEKRLDRDSDEPEVHYGLIASANTVMKSAQHRDKLRDIWNVSCFEMEAAGLMDNFPCMVIRGICDYSDDHKNDIWQPYAAVAAAAYAKDLLRIVSVDDVKGIPPAAKVINPPAVAAPDRGPPIVNQDFTQLRESLRQIETQIQGLGDRQSVQLRESLERIEAQIRALGGRPAIQPPGLPESSKRHLRGFYDQGRVDEAVKQHGELFRRDLQQLMSSYRHNYWDYMPQSLHRMRDFEVRYNLNQVAKALQQGETLLGEPVTASTPNGRVRNYSEEDTWRYILAGVGHRYQHTAWMNQNHAVWNLVFLWNYVSGVEVPLDF
ncbi:hypothetical protein FQN51_003427 [Onygenales sp. PD_10]|nr:hypothetical protein FQN51_003427 [Onygenales sp. PD_10]